MTQTLAVSPDEKVRRREAKAARRREAQNGTLDAVTRYRVLQSTLKAETDFLELADKKARFALVILSVLNAVVLVLAVRAKGTMPSSEPWGFALQGLLAAYGLGAVYYIWQAIESLRPRGKGLREPEPAARPGAAGGSLRILFHSDIARRSPAEYRGVWAGARMDSIVAELCDQVHMVSRINVVKYDALGRLYTGLGILTAMVLLMVLTVAAFHWQH